MTELAPAARRLLADSDADADRALAGLRSWAQLMAQQNMAPAFWLELLAGRWKVHLSVHNSLFHVSGVGCSASIVEACANAMSDLEAAVSRQLGARS